MARSPEALVEPDLLIWARKSAGLTEEEAARKTGVTQERLQAWERGDARPTIVQLRKLGNAYKRPIAVFYLARPPKDFVPLRDFRHFREEARAELSPTLRFEIREAHSRRDVALELHAETQTRLGRFSPKAQLEENPEEVGARIRKILGVTYEQQSNWSQAYEPFNNWRSLLEGVGVLVFQARGVEPSEIRGFSITRTTLPVVVVNRADSLGGRVFTMLHEFVHIMLRSGGLCDLHDLVGRDSKEDITESFCNHVAGAALVPADKLLSESIVLAREEADRWSEREISQLSWRYGVSREVIVRRLLTLGKTSKEFYQEKHKQYIQEYKAWQSSRPRGFVPPHVDAISSLGKAFTHLVLGAFYQDAITASRVADYLGIKLGHLSKLERQLRLVWTQD